MSGLHRCRITSEHEPHAEYCRAFVHAGVRVCMGVPVRATWDFDVIPVCQKDHALPVGDITHGWRAHD